MKAEAERILEETQLLSILAPHGEARVVGSVALDLVVKRDIDVHLLVAEGTDLFDVACSVCRKLFGEGNVHELRITRYPEKGSVKVAVDHEFAHLRGRCPKGGAHPGGVWGVPFLPGDTMTGKERWCGHACGCDLCPGA